MANWLPIGNGNAIPIRAEAGRSISMKIRKPETKCHNAKDKNDEKDAHHVPP